MINNTSLGYNLTSHTLPSRCYVDTIKKNLTWFNDQLDYIKIKNLPKSILLTVTEDNGYVKEKRTLTYHLSGSVSVSAGREEIGGRVLHYTICVSVSWRTNVLYFVFCRLCPFSLQPPRQSLGPTCYLSTLHKLTLYRRCGGLPIHMMGEVSWKPQGRRAWALKLNSKK